MKQKKASRKFVLILVIIYFIALSVQTYVLYDYATGPPTAEATTVLGNVQVKVVEPAPPPPPPRPGRGIPEIPPPIPPPPPVDLCADSIQDQDETDIDCGGRICAPCATAESCLVNRDCESDFCRIGTCVKPEIAPLVIPAPITVTMLNIVVLLVLLGIVLTILVIGSRLFLR